MALAKFTLSLQENILSVLCFSDAAAGIVVGLVDPRLFDNEIYRRIAQAAINYHNRYRRPPRVHVADLLDTELASNDKTRARAFRNALRNLYRSKKEGFNEEYILTSLREFLRQQHLKAGILKSARLLQAGQTEEAQSAILKSIAKHDAALDIGLRMRDAIPLLRELRTSDGDEWFRTGITALDELGIGPTRKTLTLLMAATNRGKTWGLIHFSRALMQQRLTVLHVTLEMSEKRILSRYLQTIFSMKRPGAKASKVPFTRVKSADDGTFLKSTVRHKFRQALTTFTGLKKVKRKLITQKMLPRLKLIVKEFPTGSLTVRELESYLDNLERVARFVPDVLVLDYADLMDIDKKFLRTDTGRVYQELRGLAVKRNIVVITATQSNRGGEDTSLITLRHASEDYSKMATSDLVITYNQTRAEKQTGVARLFVAKARDERSGDIIIMGQSYEVGQFHTSSALLTNVNAYMKSLDVGDESDEVPKQKKKRRKKMGDDND